MRLLMVFFLTSCGYNVQHRDFRSDDKLTFEVDNELAPYVSEFISELMSRNIKYEIKFKSIKLVDQLEKGAVGMCYYYNKVEILRRTMTPIRLKALVFHELGHCIMHLDHDPEDSMQIMQPVEIVDSTYLEENWDSLVDHLFNTKPTKLFLNGDINE